MSADPRMRGGTRGTSLIRLLGVLLVGAMPGGSLAQETHGESWATAKMEFKRHCAVCHGVDAKGNGPIASTLKYLPTDLTQLSKNNGGTFPRQRVSDAIDGSVEVRTHGPRDMPVWGVQFKAEQPSGEMAGHLHARITIQWLIDYLVSIQEP